MKKIFSLITIGLILSTLLLPTLSTEVEATDACPESMPIQERYLCLQKELEKLEGNQGSLEKKLKDEDYQQLSLKEKISYISGQISQTESVINTLHMEITTQDVEISILTKDIQEKEDSLSILKQEINTLQETVNKRVTESYKYSFVGALELFMDIKNIDTLLRKTKYLIETRAKDKVSLEEYNNKMADVESEEQVLAENKVELQKKRNDIEDEKAKLVDEKASLDSQKAEKDRLLAESLKRENEYKSQLQVVTKAISEADNVVSELVIQLFNQGLLGNGMPVAAGQTIAYQGHTGCSYGSHMHFDIRNSSNVRLNPIPTFLTNSGGYLLSNKYLTPLRSAYITQYYSSSHLALDMVSTADGNQNLEKYTVPRGLCPIVDSLIDRYGNQAYLTGEGAPIKAIAAGKVYYGIESSWGGKYALVVHNDGYKSFYLHIR